MKKIYFISLITLFSFGTYQASSAQSQKPMQRIEALKIAYISQRLNLTPEEAEKFWPVYNEYEKQMQQLREERRQSMLNSKELSTANDKQVNQSLNDEMDYEQKMIDLRKEYRDKFSAVLPPRKVALLFEAEKDFTNQLIKLLQQRRQNLRNSNR